MGRRDPTSEGSMGRINRAITQEFRDCPEKGDSSKSLSKNIFYLSRVIWV